MLAEALTALATAGGTAVVQAAGKDAWAGFRDRVAKWFALGDAEREHDVLERLDRTAAVLEAATPSEVERLRDRQEASWQTLFEVLLEGLNPDDQQRAADKLRDLLIGFSGSRITSVGNDSVTIAGDVNIQAKTGGVAAWEMNEVQIGHPFGGSTGPVGMSADPHQPGRPRG